jgi:hypothetical protein
MPLDGMSEHTPLVFPKLVHHKLIGIRLGVEAVEGFEGHRQVARADVYGTPRCHCFKLVDFRLDVFEMSLAEAF